ncbi:hypothetical protein R6Z07F_009411 [Ovis aries]
MLQHEYTTKEVFPNNSFSDWRKKLKEEKEKLQQEFGYCILDGHREKIGSFETEPLVSPRLGRPPQDGEAEEEGPAGGRGRQLQQGLCSTRAPSRPPVEGGRVCPHSHEAGGMDGERAEPHQTASPNRHLQDPRDGLTARVFRTYNASVMLQGQLQALP